MARGRPHYAACRIRRYPALPLPFLAAILTALGACSAAEAAEGDYLWSVSAGDISTEEAVHTAVDGAGNVYVTGSFRTTVDFDPGPGVTALAASNNSDDIFLAKYDPDGALVWVHGFGNTAVDRGYGVACDGSGNVLITGHFRLTVDFDPGAGTASLTAAGNSDIFVAKYTSGGDYVWAGRMGGTMADRGHAIVADSDGAALVAGYFIGSADFDPGAGTTTLNAGGTTGCFAMKLNADGTLAWARFVGAGASDIAYGIATDGDDAAYVTGTVTGAVDFDPGVGTATQGTAGVAEAFVLKLDEDGVYEWASIFPESAAILGSEIAVDGAGNVYAVGSFSAATDFDPGVGTATVSPAGMQDGYVVKLDATGALVWVQAIGGTQNDEAAGVALDAGGNVYVSGSFGGTVDFDAGVGTANRTAGGTSDGYVLKLDETGAFLAVYTFTSDGDAVAESAAIDVDGNAIAAGSYTGTADFDPGAGAAGATSNGDADLFVVALSGPPVPDVTSIALSGPSLTNGSSATFTVTFSEDVTGVDAGDFALTTTGTLAGASVTSVTGSGSSYAVEVSTGTGDGTLRLDLADDDTIVSANSGLPLGGTGLGDGSFTAGDVLTIDRTAPVLTLTSGAADPTNAVAIAVTASFTESVTGFTAGDVSAINGSIANFAGSGLAYTFDLIPLADGLVSATVAAGAAADAAGNGNDGPVTLSRTYDGTAPSAALASAAPALTNQASFSVTLTFSETVTGLSLGDIAAANGVVSGLSGSGDAYAFTVTALGDGPVSVSLPAGAAADAAGNGNTAAPAIGWTYDGTAPGVTLSSATGNPYNGTLTVTVSFDEAVTGFAASDVVVTNGAAIGFAGSGADYALQIAATDEGPVSVSVPSGVAADGAGNGNTASGPLTRTFDSIPPGIAVSAPSRTLVNGGTVTYEVTYTDFDTVSLSAADVTVVTGGTTAMAAVSGGGGSWTVTLSGIGGNGLTGIIVAAGTALDAAGNAASSATGAFFTVDTIAPEVTVTPLTTANPAPAIVGRVDDGAASVRVTLGGVSADAANDGMGNWSLPAGAFGALDYGVYSLRAEATDLAGNVGVDGTEGELTIVPPPPAPAIATNGGLDFTIGLTPVVIAGTTVAADTERILLNGVAIPGYTPFTGEWSVSVHLTPGGVPTALAFQAANGFDAASPQTLIRVTYIAGYDTDGDGLPDAAEGWGDPDGDGVPNYRDEDSDGDGYSDSWETESMTDPYDGGSRPAAEDINRDGRVDAIDVQLAINASLGLDIGRFAADIDRDGSVTVTDIQWVVRAALGLGGIGVR